MKLDRKERSEQIERWNNTKLTSGDILAYKFSGTALMYVLKFARVGAQAGALFLAQKIFAETYVREVVSDGAGAAPPPLTRMLLTFLSIDATVQLAVLLVLVLLSYTHSGPGNAYIIDDDFIVTFLLEYFITTVIVATLGTLFAGMMRDKRYFEFSSQGRVVGRAYRDVMIGVCAVFGAVPFFVIGGY